MGRFIFLVITMAVAAASQAQQNIKLSVAQYRIADDSQSYNYTPVSIKYSTNQYQARVMLPYIRGYKTRSGLGNASIKLSYLTQWKKTFIDFNYKQKLATADDRLTVPVRDNGVSIELSRYLLGGIGFIELGHTWRNNAHSRLAERNDSFYYALGGMYPIKKGLSLGLLIDHKPTALGQLDRSLTTLGQYKLNSHQRLGFSISKGLTATSPKWLVGLVWSYKY